MLELFIEILVIYKMMFEKIQQKYVSQKHQYLYFVILVYFRVKKRYLSLLQFTLLLVF